MGVPAVFAGLRDFRRLDTLAAGQSPIHGLDARAKLVVAGAFLVAALSFDRHAVVPLLPFFALAAVVAQRAGLPLPWLARRAATVVPLALLVALPNPFFEHETAARVAGIAVSAGWLSLVSIVLRAVLAALAVLILVATTGLPDLCAALERLRVPRPLVVQLLLLYRYLLLLGDEGARLAAARSLRSRGRPLSLPMFGLLAGRLLDRTWTRADRIYAAMRARGFAGTLPLGRAGRFARADAAATVVGLTVVATLRLLPMWA